MLGKRGGTENRGLDECGFEHFRKLYPEPILPVDPLRREWDNGKDFPKEWPGGIGPYFVEGALCSFYSAPTSLCGLGWNYGESSRKWIRAMIKRHYSGNIYQKGIMA